MPDKKGRFTPQEIAFVEAMVATHDPIYAAQKAGYATSQSAYLNLRKPAVVARIRELTNRRLERLVPLALDHYEAVLTDPKAPTRDKTIVAGNVTKLSMQLGEDANETKDLHAMTAGEIAREIARLKGDLARRPEQAKDVTPAVVDVTPEADDPSVFG